MNKIKKYMLLGLLIIPFNVGALTKTESVYTNLNSDGSINKSVVTNHLYLNGKTSLEDYTELTSIMNINGNEEFTLNNNKLSFNNVNKDIYYEGVINKTLPITTKVSYYLDNEKKDVKDIIGKKGNIKIKFEFTNNNKSYLNGKSIYTPFVVTVGTIINNEDNSNIKVSNGKVVDTGTRSTVLGLSSPGLYESLNISNLSKLNTVTISYKTNNFSTNDFYIVATPKLLSDVDLSVFNKVDSLTESANSLSINMNKLIDGINKIDNGNKLLESNTKSLSTNMNSISNYIDLITSKTGDLNNNIKLLKESIIESKTNLNNLVNSTDTSDIDKVLSSNNSTKETLINKTNHTYEELLTIYNNNLLKDYTGTDETLLNVKNTVELITLLDSNTKAIKGLQNNTLNLVSNVNSSLDELILNIDKLYLGTSSLNENMNSINNNTKKINAGTKKLSDSTKELKSGSEELLIGAKEYNEQGINKIVEYSNIISDKSDTVKKLVSMSKNYKGYASNNSDESIFIFKIDAIR